MNSTSQAKTRKRRKLNLKNLIWFLITKLLPFLRGPIVRHLYQISSLDNADLIFKQAETIDEVQQALELVFESYHEIGLVPDMKCKMRATKFHMLPTTSILICKKNDRVIATATVIIDSALGLPIDEMCDISDLRSQSVRIAEISTLAIEKEFRKQRGQFLLQLCAYIYRTSLISGVDRFVASYHPHAQDFYLSVLLFSQLSGGKVVSNPSVQGAAAVFGTLLLKDVDVKYKNVYGRKSGLKNIHAVFNGPLPKNFLFSDEVADSCSRFIFTPDLLDSVFKQKTGITQKLSQQDKRVLAETFFHEEYRKLFEMDQLKSQRSAARFLTHLDAELRGLGEDSFELVKVLEVSRYGLKLATNNQHKTRQLLEAIVLNVTLPDGTSTFITGKVVWHSVDKRHYGVELNRFVPSAWQKFITANENRIGRMVQEKALRAMA